MAVRPPEALEAAALKAWLLTTVLWRSRQPYEVAAAMAVALSAMARPLAAWCAARPRQLFGALSSAPALKNAASSSCAKHHFGDVHHGVYWQWLWMQVALDLPLREHAARATVQRHLCGLRTALARRAWAPRVGARPHTPVRVPMAADAQLRAAVVAVGGSPWGPAARDSRPGYRTGRGRRWHGARRSHGALRRRRALVCGPQTNATRIRR